MPEFNIIEERTVVQHRSSIVEAVSEDAIFLNEEYREITNLSDWETVSSDEYIVHAEVWQ